MAGDLWGSLWCTLWAPLLGLGVAACASMGCAGSQVPPAPEPLRPEVRDVARTDDLRTDCEEVGPADGAAPLSFQERSIAEAENLADQGATMMQQSAKRGVADRDRERLIEQAVHRFVTALLADPYNVDATYHLAAAYARIGRSQCAVNLLARLVPLRRLESQAAKVEAKLDRLFGRGEFTGKLDPDFFDLRDDPRFRDLARKF